MPVHLLSPVNLPLSRISCRSSVIRHWMCGLLCPYTHTSLTTESSEALTASHTVPDLALTLSTQVGEAKLLEYIWPEFVWVNVSNGFTDQSKTKRFEQHIMSGADCKLKVGYDPTSDTPTTWPVFCLTDSDQKLQARFGDPLWRYLQVRLYRCNSTDWDKSLQSTPQLTSGLQQKWSGKCASSEEIEGFIAGLSINIFFRLEREDFKRKAFANGGAGRLQPPRGCRYLN